jgi:hypothetical protein
MPEQRGSVFEVGSQHFRRIILERLNVVGLDVEMLDQSGKSIPFALQQGLISNALMLTSSKSLIMISGANPLSNLRSSLKIRM